jgi:excisionase family DNA binding protein
VSDPPFLTVQQIAERLGLMKSDVVLAWIKSGELPAHNIGTNPGGRPTWRIALVDLDGFLERRRAVPTATAVRRRKVKRPLVTNYF